MMLLLAAAVAWCQGTMTFDSGVAQFESGPEWVAGPSALCEPYTILSPDGGRVGREKTRVRPDAGHAQTGVSDRVLRSTIPVGESCKSVYRLKTVEITFPKEGTGLTKEQEGQLASLLFEKPEGFSVIRYVESRDGRNTEKTPDARVAAVRTYLERFQATRPSISEEQRLVKTPKPSGPSVTVTAIYRGDCRVRQGGSPEGRQAGVGSVGLSDQSKEGVP